jgi:hypothetical protein
MRILRKRCQSAWMYIRQIREAKTATPANANLIPKRSLYSYGIG